MSTHGSSTAATNANIDRASTVLAARYGAAENGVVSRHKDPKTPRPAKPKDVSVATKSATKRMRSPDALARPKRPKISSDAKAAVLQDKQRAKQVIAKGKAADKQRAKLRKDFERLSQKTTDNLTSMRQLMAMG